MKKIGSAGYFIRMIVCIGVAVLPGATVVPASGNAAKTGGRIYSDYIFSKYID